MFPFYDAVKADADDLIEENGVDASLLVPDLTGDAWNPTVANMEYLVKVVRSSFTYTDRGKFAIEQGDLKLLCVVPESGVVPSIKHKIVVDSEEYSIVDVDRVAPGGTTVYYVLQVRR